MAETPVINLHKPAVGEPLLLTTKDAARALSISPRTLWGLTARREIPHVRVQRRVMYSPDALRSWIAQRTKGGQS